MPGTSLDLSRFEALTFDCYGTLIDWETGIARALRPVLEAHEWSGSDDDALALFASIESTVQAGPYLPYSDVLRRVVDEIAAATGFEPSEAEREALAGSVGEWPAFPDTHDALDSLSSGFRLAIVSNVDDALFALSDVQLGVEWDAVVTAEQVRSYKPREGHFREVLRRLDLPVDRVLHVAQSLFHDVEPASRLGFSTVWVNRRRGREGFGATPEAGATPDLEVADLASLARLADEW